METKSSKNKQEDETEDIEAIGRCSRSSAKSVAMMIQFLSRSAVRFFSEMKDGKEAAPRHFRREDGHAGD